MIQSGSLVHAQQALAFLQEFRWKNRNNSRKALSIMINKLKHYIFQKGYIVRRAARRHLDLKLIAPRPRKPKHTRLQDPRAWFIYECEQAIWVSLERLPLIILEEPNPVAQEIIEWRLKNE